jgi:hypothetical protein
VHVVQHAEAAVGQRQRLAQRERPPDAGVEVAGGGDDRPAGPGDVAGVQHDARDAAAARLVVEQLLDRGLADAVVAHRRARFVLRDRHAVNGPVDPDRAAVQEQRADRPQRLDEPTRGLGREAHEVDDDVGLHRRDPGAERAGRVLGIPVDDDPVDP